MFDHVRIETLTSDTLMDFLAVCQISEKGIKGAGKVKIASIQIRFISAMVF